MGLDLWEGDLKTEKNSTPVPFTSLLPRGQMLLRTQEGPDQRHRCDQGVGAQIGAGLLSHAERGQAVRRAQVLCMKFRRDRMSHLRGLAQSHESD